MLAFALIFVIGSAACRKEGPAEKIGREIDEGVEEVGSNRPENDAGEKVGREIDEVLEEVKAAVKDDGPAEDLGEKIDEVLDDRRK